MLRKLIASAGALALLLVVAVATPSGQGLRSDRAVYFTFSQPVALPGKTLPAGKYLFKLLDSPTTRTMVQVYNAEGTQQIAMFMTVPAERLDRPNDAEVRFMEANANGPAAIRTWWYPGERRGWEFIYPRSEALQLAKNAKEPVLTTTEDTSVDKMSDATLTRVGANGDQTPYDANATAAASATSGTAVTGTRQDTTTTSSSTTTTPTATATTRTPTMQTTPQTPRADVNEPAQTTPAAPARTTRDRDALPHTASATPMVLLIGLAAFAAAWVLRRMHPLA